MTEPPRCRWAAGAAPLDQAYHDAEWGVPVHDDRLLLELLTLEGAQAGLSWSTVLAKREGYRRCFAGFDPVAVAALTAADVDRIVVDPAVVRHRGKLESTVANAAAMLEVAAANGSFATWLWDHVDGTPVVTRRPDDAGLPATTPLGDLISKELKKLGFRFVGPTITYAYLQAVGVVDDHTIGCHRAG